MVVEAPETDLGSPASSCTGSLLLPSTLRLLDNRRTALRTARSVLLSPSPTLLALDTAARTQGLPFRGMRNVGRPFCSQFPVDWGVRLP